ncbi:MAG: sugar phosphate isomerase/epimerase [Candidatus Hydrogenedentes bacterium]|nr:sugar phosphate isomerase/epimerase [Candidatus Hydrogenedentota bacterium]
MKKIGATKQPFSMVSNPALAWAGAAGGRQYTVGAQSYSFREFKKLEDSIACLRKLGLSHMEFCGVHFPPDKDDANFEVVKRALEQAGVSVPCYGVEGFGADSAANQKKFEFAKALGVKVLTADPAPESFDNLDDLTAEFGVKVAIHNHGPGARYDKVADTLRALEKHSSMIGACVDTGHSIRSQEKPHEVITALGDRVHSLHLKDWRFGGPETILGEGDMDMAAVARALHTVGFNGPIMMEYEESATDPVPDMRKGLDNWRRASSST